MAATPPSVCHGLHGLAATMTPAPLHAQYVPYTGCKYDNYINSVSQFSMTLAEGLVAMRTSSSTNEVVQLVAAKATLSTPDEDYSKAGLMKY